MIMHIFFLTSLDLNRLLWFWGKISNSTQRQVPSSLSPPPPFCKTLQHFFFCPNMYTTSPTTPIGPITSQLISPTPSSMPIHSTSTWHTRTYFSPSLGPLISPILYVAWPQPTIWPSCQTFSHQWCCNGLIHIANTQSLNSTIHWADFVWDKVGTPLVSKPKSWIVLTLSSQIIFSKARKSYE